MTGDAGGGRGGPPTCCLEVLGHSREPGKLRVEIFRRIVQRDGNCGCVALHADFLASVQGRADLRCLDRGFEFVGGAQAEYLRVPLADGTLVATPDLPADGHVASLLSCSDVMGTGWYAAVAAEVGPGSTVAVVGDGAVGLCAIIAAKELGAERIIAMSRHASRQALARAFGATDIIAERGEDGVAQVKELTDGVGADAVLECVGTPESMRQALHSTRPGGNVGFVGVPHGVEINGEELFYSHVALRGGPAPVRGFLPDLIERVLAGRINPGKVFDLTLPLDEIAEGYRAMDERRAIKALVRP